MLTVRALAISLLLIAQAGCATKQAPVVHVPIEGPQRIAWVMPGSPTRTNARLWWCESDGVTTTCEPTLLPIQGMRSGCALSSDSRLFVAVALELYKEDTAIASLDIQARQSRIEIERIVLEPKVNRQRFAALRETLYFASDEGLMSLDVKTRRSTMVLRRELRKDFGVIRNENELLISLSGGTLGRWTPQGGLQVTAIKVENIKPSRVWNDILVGLYIDPRLHKNSSGVEWSEPPTPAYIPLDESKVDLAHTLAAKRFGYKGPLDVWIIKDGPMLVGDSEKPPQFCFIPSPGVLLAHWGPQNVSYWSYGAEIPAAK